MDSFGAALITGPNWCGESTTAKTVAKSVMDIADLVKVTAIKVAYTREDGVHAMSLTCLKD